MKRDIELQKPVAHTSIWLGKMESDLKIKKYDAQKAKKLAHQLKYKKFLASISQWDVLIQKEQMLWWIWSQMKSFKFILSSFVGGHICIFL